VDHLKIKHMKIPLNDFEFYIDEPVLKKGLAYFKKGAVSELVETAKGEFEALVQGTNEYLVTMSIKKAEINHFHCTCLYDQGLICKHVAAVIFYMEQESLGIAAAAPKAKQVKSKPAAKKASKKKTIPEQVVAVTAQLQKEELVNFIVSQSENNKQFAQGFLDYFADKNEFESIAAYAKQIRSIISSLSAKNRYNPWKNVGLIGRAVYEKYLIAASHLEKGNDQTAAFMCLAISEEMVRAINYLDDSNADISSVIEMALQTFKKLRDKKIPDALREQIFEYCVEAFLKKKFGGWDWHISMLQIASDFKSGNQDVERLLKIIVQQDPVGDYAAEELEILQFKLLYNSGREQEAEQFLQANLHNTSFRREAIIQAIQEKNYQRAIELAEHGILLDQKTSPAYVITWKTFLLEVAQKQKDTDKVVQYARELFLVYTAKREEYYQLIKTSTAPKNWAAMVEMLLQDTNQLHSWDAKPILAAIFTWEEQWDQLLKLVSEKPSFAELTKYELPLLEHYPEAWKNLYGTAIIEYAQLANSRANYKEIVKQLVKLYKSGGEANVQKIVNILRTVFKNRPTLMKELRVF